MRTTEHELPKSMHRSQPAKTMIPRALELPVSEPRIQRVRVRIRTDTYLSNAREFCDSTWMGEGWGLATPLTQPIKQLRKRCGLSSVRIPGCCKGAAATIQQSPCYVLATCVQEERPKYSTATPDFGGSGFPLLITLGARYDTRGSGWGESTPLPPVSIAHSSSRLCRA